MTPSEAAILIAIVATALLAVTVLSGAGPLTSLRKAIGGFREVREEAERLRFNGERVRDRARRLALDMRAVRAGSEPSAARDVPQLHDR